MASEKFRICGVYDGDTLIYLGKADRPCSQWFYGLKQREPFSWYLKQYPDKHLRIKTITSFVRKSTRDKAYVDMYFELHPVFENKSFRTRQRITVSSPVDELIATE